MFGIWQKRRARDARQALARGLALLVAACLANPARAQSENSAAATVPAATIPSRSTPAANAAVVTPAIAAEDPMLAPPGDAPKQIADWDEAIAIIRQSSPAYASSRETVARAEAQKRITLAGELPTVTGIGSYTHQFYTAAAALATPTGQPLTIVSPPVDSLGISATANWTLINPRALYGLGTANRAIDAARLNDADARRQIATNVVGAMLSTLAGSRVAELNRVGLRSALERLGLTQARFQYGQGTALDVDRAQQDVAVARSQLISGDESLQEMRESFGAAIGSRIPTAAKPSLDLEAFEAAVARTCKLNDQIEARPDVAAARLRLEVAERAITDADLQIAPTLSVSSTVSYATAVSLGPLKRWDVAALLTLPIYDGGARYGVRRDAIAVAEQARQALETTRINAQVDSERAQRNVTVIKASRDLALEQRDIARRVDVRTRDAYQRGQGTSLDLVTSAQSLRQAEINLALLDFQVAQARANAVLANAECVY